MALYAVLRAGVAEPIALFSDRDLAEIQAGVERARGLRFGDLRPVRVALWSTGRLGFPPPTVPVEEEPSG